MHPNAHPEFTARRLASINEKKARGEVMHLAPLGYKNARDERGRSIIVPDPETYPLVMEARRMREEGMSIRKICKEMKDRGLRSQRSNPISAMAIWRITS